MAETTQFTIGAPASCRDGVCGEVIRVVVDPVARVVTHLVVEPRHRVGHGRLVPLDLVEATTDKVLLRCTMAEFEKLDWAEETQFLSGSGGHAGYSPEQVLSWPYYGLGGGGMGLGMGNISEPIVLARIHREIEPDRAAYPRKVPSCKGKWWLLTPTTPPTGRHYFDGLILPQPRPFRRDL